MRALGLLIFEEEETVEEGRKPKGEIKNTDLWQRIRVAFSGMSMSRGYNVDQLPANHSLEFAESISVTSGRRP